MSFVDLLSPEDVRDPVTFAEYVRQICGTPYCSGKDMAVLKRKLKDFFAAHPHVSYYTLCRTAQWARSKKRRPSKVYTIIALVPYAWGDGHLPEMDPANRTDPDLDAAIYAALEHETDPLWRTQLLGAEGVKARQEVFDAWKRTARV